VRDPSRNIPWALIIGTLGVTGIYLLINWAYVRALGWEAAQDSQKAIAANVLNRLPGGFGEQLMCVLVMISALGAINGLVFTSARVYATMGAEYSLFSWLGERHPRTGAPIMSLLIQMFISLGMVLGVSILEGNRSGFSTLLQCSAPIFWFFFLLTAMAVIILRFKDRHLERPFRVPAFPILPLIFIATCGFMLYSATDYATLLGYAALAGPALVVAGLPFYFLSRRTPLPEPVAAVPSKDLETAEAPGLPPPGSDETGISSGEPPLNPGE
jgi:amino acid transporter